MTECSKIMSSHLQPFTEGMFTFALCYVKPIRKDLLWITQKLENKLKEENMTEIGKSCLVKTMERVIC